MISRIKKKIKGIAFIHESYVEAMNYKRYKKNRKKCSVSPELMIKEMYREITQQELNLDDPQTFNEKLQWLKLYWYDEKATICTDKYLVRDYVKEKGLENILNELIGVYDNVDKINLDLLPDKFVLKPTHDSGHTIVCKSKDGFNLSKTKRKLKRWLKINYTFMSGEWPYRNVSPQIICEKYISDNSTDSLTDYKFFCINGEPRIIEVDIDRFTAHKQNFYDINWNRLNVSRMYPTAPEVVVKKPDALGDMIEIAKKLSEGFPFVRVDLYYVNFKVIFGELTFFPSGGFSQFQPYDVELKLGQQLELPEKKNAWENIYSNF